MLCVTGVYYRDIIYTIFSILHLNVSHLSAFLLIYTYFFVCAVLALLSCVSLFHFLHREVQHTKKENW